MKKILKIFLILVVLILVIVGGFALYIQVSGIPKYDVPPKSDLKVEATPERLATGEKIFATLCLSCHLNTKTGKATGDLLADVPEQFGTIYSRNITQHPEAGIGKWTDGEIFHLLRTGVKPDGQYLPPYMPGMPKAADEEVYSVIAFLRSSHGIVQPSADEPPPTQPSFLAKFLSHVAFKPLPFITGIQMPDTTNVVEWGKYLATGLYECYSCHSKDFKTMNVLEPEKSEGFFGGGNQTLNKERKLVPTANLTPDPETGIGKWTEDQFIAAVREGRKPDGTPLKYPMVPYSRLDTLEVRAIFAYLKTVPPIINKVDRAK